MEDMQVDEITRKSVQNEKWVENKTYRFGDNPWYHFFSTGWCFGTHFCCGLNIYLVASPIIDIVETKRKTSLTWGG